MIRARIHTLVLWFILIDYGVYSLAVGIQKTGWLYCVVGIYALLAAFGTATGKSWSKPFVWTLGVLILLEWVVYTAAAYRGGNSRPVEFGIALVPGLAMASVVGYCCYVVDAYVVPRRRAPL